MKNLLFLPLLLLCTSCTPKSWIYQEIVTSYPEYDSRQLAFVPKNPLYGLGLQFLKGNFGTVGYCHVYTGKIPEQEPDSPYASIALNVDGNTHYFKAIRMQGSQRLRLPEELTEKLIQLLLTAQPLTLSLKEKSFHIESENFSSEYHKFAR